MTTDTTNNNQSPIHSPNSTGVDTAHNNLIESNVSVISSEAKQGTNSEPTFRSVLEQPAVRALWIASFVSYIGDTFAMMALFILVNQVTHSTVALGALAVAETVPLLLALVAGMLVDRWRYRPVLLITDLLRAALLPLYLLFGSSNDLWIVLAATFAISMASRFFFPASQALRRALLRPKEYSIAASLWQATYGISYVLGPALAGLLISTFGTDVRAGVTLALIVDALSFAISALIIFVLVREKAQAVDAARQTSERKAPWDDLREGWSIMWGSKPIRGVMTLYGVGLLGVGAVFVLTVPYVQGSFGGGPWEIGLLEAAQALGLAVGATAVGTIFSRKIPAGNLMLWSSLVGGLSVIGLGLAPVYVVSLLVMLVMGVTVGAVESSGASITLHEIPQHHQGKGNSSLNTLLNASYLISVGVSGFAGQAVGIKNSFVVGGIIALLAVALAVPLLSSRHEKDASTGPLQTEQKQPGIRN